MGEKKRNAVYAGSFDPMTNGHLHVMTTAAKLFDQLFVVVATNAAKTPASGILERVQSIEFIAHNRGLANVKVMVSEAEFVARRAVALGCGYLIRGVRGASDIESELAIAHINSLAAPGIESIVLMAPQGLEDVSSSMVRGLVGLLGWRGIVRRMVPHETLRRLEIRRAAELVTWTARLARLVFTFPTEEMIQRYLEGWRRYHSIGHIVECLEWLQHAQEQAQRPDLVALALWFHDVIYDPRAKDNEQKSADLATVMMKHWLSSEDRDRVVEMILATARHFDADFNPTDPDTQLMLDIDLAVFAESPEEQKVIKEAIRYEYGFVPEEIYRTKRAELLTQLRARPFIYRTEFFRGLLEKNARVNLSSEIEELTSRR